MGKIIKYAWRFLFKQPFSTFVAVTIIALGIGANTAMFAVIYSVLLKPLPYPGSRELVNVWDVQDNQTGPMSFAEFESLSGRAGPLKSVAAYFSQSSVISSGGTAEKIGVIRASTRLLSLLGQSPLIGAGFTPDADIPGSNHEMMISVDLWHRRYGTDASVIGKTSLLGRQLYTIVGVLPADFHFVKDTDILIPLRLNTSTAPPGLHFLNIVGRMRPHLQPEEATAQLQSSLGESPQGSHGLQVIGLRAEMISSARTPALLLFAATGLILLIAFANVGNLILVQSASRQREIAVRLALGASRTRIVMQFLSESYTIALLGGAAGVLIAWFVLQWAHNSAFLFLPRSDEIHLHNTVFLFTFAVSSVAGFVLGLGAILQAKVRDIHEALRSVRQGGISHVARRWLDALVTSEIALTVILLLGSGLLIRSFVKVVHENKGFIPDHVFSLEFYVSNNSTPEKTLAFYNQMRQELTVKPGIESVGIVNTVPLTGSIDGTINVRESQNTTASNLTTAKILADGEYFSILKIPLIAGRLFNNHDSIESPRVAIIDETLARKICGQSLCLGKSVDFSWGKQEWAQIVGVVGAVRQDSLEISPKPTIYVPYQQKPDLLDNITLKMIVRSQLKREIAEAEFRQAVLNVDKTQPSPRVKTMSEILDASLATRQVILSLLGLLAALALLLSILGIYGVIAYSVATRTAEFGVRMALGAQPRHVLRLVLGHGVRLAGIGITIGLGCSIFGMRLLASMLYGISALDAITLLSVIAVITLAVVSACWIPSKRALAVEPSVSLKSE